MRRSLETTGDLAVLSARLRIGILMAVETKHIEVEDPNEEIKLCNAILDEQTNDINSLKTKTRSPKFRRIQTRLIHVINRLSNLKGVASEFSAKAEPLIIEARELIATMEALIGPNMDSETDLSDVDGDKLKIQKANKSGGLTPKRRVSAGAQTEDVGLITASDRLCPDTCQSHSGFRYPSEPVYKWKLDKFTGENPDKALDFMEDVEERAQTRSVSLVRLLRESAELFEGEALVWYRDAIRRVSTWQELKREFLIAYQAYGNDSNLRDRIRGCKQSESQSIDVFLGKMEGMYSRLERPVSETERLEEILRNLNPFLKEKLVMTPMSSIHHLRVSARLAEAGRLRMGSAPAHLPVSQTQKPVGVVGRVASVASDSLPSAGLVEALQGSGGETFKCYNCGSGDHPHRSCPLPRKKFCFRCGLPDATTFSCSRCNKRQQKND
ncbi:hypothetical protein GE061_015872 [Apolygus lucorum]|uniref:CCHC-type domain-containing protein n=1 Tax=Apolygus lucorum TaxID=248454 RepID=A0A8S9XQ15_APOLU|nr:hypothetical protein GE061_015872 [Apolygus lucorum]